MWHFPQICVLAHERFCNSLTCIVTFLFSSNIIKHWESLEERKKKIKMYKYFILNLISNNDITSDADTFVCDCVSVTHKKKSYLSSTRNLNFKFVCRLTCEKWLRKCEMSLWFWLIRKSRLERNINKEGRSWSRGIAD